MEEFNYQSCNTLFNYFYIFGANEKTVKREKFFVDNLFTIPGYLKMKLISKFPPFEKPNSNIEENVIMSHCFPSGFNLYVSENPNEKKMIDTFHFCLDNLNSLENYDKKIYFTSLLFYEPLIIYFEILMRLKQNKLTITSQTKELMEKYYVPKVICLSSFVPFPTEEKYLLVRLLYYVNEMTKGKNNILIPIEKIIEKLIYGIPLPPRGLFFIRIEKNFTIIPNDKQEYNIKQRKLNEYNYYSYKMHLIFVFKIDEILEIIKCLLLEIPILFFSKNKENLTNIFETFLWLINPFEYQYPHVSILPDINARIIEIAKSFAFGINYEWVDQDNKEKKKNYFEMLNINAFNKLIKIVDIDNRILKDYLVPNKEQKINDLKKGNIKDDSSLLSKEIKYRLPEYWKIKKYLSDLLDLNKHKKSDCNMYLNREIGEECFYKFFISVFRNYNKYLFNSEEEIRKICHEIKEKNNDDEIPIEHLCKIKEFINEFSGDDKKFLNKFFLTSIFKNFLIRKYLNNDIDKYIFLHFDENILFKKIMNSFTSYIIEDKRKTEFLNCKLFEIEYIYRVDSVNRFSQEEYEYITSHKGQLINYYQKFNGDRFKYFLFPKLIYDNQYFQKIYIPPKFFDLFLLDKMRNYQSRIKALEQPKYFKIYDGDLIIRHLYNSKNDVTINEIKNDVLLLWLKVFCLTFYYCEPEEKIIRFEEMLNNIKKALYLKNDILSLLLITLERYGEKPMIIKFFENFKTFNYNQYAYLSNKLYYSYISELPPLKHTSMCINYYKEKEDVTKYFDFELNIKNIDNNRTFWKDGIESKSEIFEFENPICPECNKKNSLKKLLHNYENMNKDKNLQCIHCNKANNFSTIVHLGSKINGEKTNINIYNPYYLYNNVSTELIKIFGNKIDFNYLKTEYKDFFWNCILNFKLVGLSYDMLLKYKKLYKIKDEKIKKEIVENEKEKEKTKEPKKEEINNLQLLDIGLNNKNNNKMDLSETNNNLNKVNNEELISIIISSEDENILYPIICKKTDKLKDIETSFCKIFPQYKNINNYFLFKQIKLDKEKNLYENKLNYGDIILIKNQEK